MDSAEPLSSILWTLTPHPGGSAAAGNDGCRGLMPILDSGVRCKSLIATSTWCLGALCSALYRSRFSRSCLACIACFSLLGEKKRCLCILFARFWITADRAYCANFVGCKSISPNRLGRTILYKAFVRFRLLKIWYFIPFSAKEETQPRVSLRNTLRANPTKEKAKHHVAAGKNDLPPNNEKRANKAQHPA